MAKSEAFARIKQQVLQVTAGVPFGRVTTFAAIGQHLDVVPRHVAYLLAVLTAEEREALPWYRVVGERGLVAKTKKEQRELLMAEGQKFDAEDKLTPFKLFPIDESTTGLPAQTRPLQALTKKRR